MNIILQEKIQNLGDLGDTVSVRAGYARNFLLPQGKALPATPEFAEVFAARRGELEAKAKTILEAAQARAKKLDGLNLTDSVRTSSTGKLYGSVGVTEIMRLITEAGHDVARPEVCLPKGTLRDLGVHDIKLALHPDVNATIHLELTSEGGLAETEVALREEAGLVEANVDEVIAHDIAEAEAEDEAIAE